MEYVSIDRTQEDVEALASAARDSVRRQVLETLRLRGPADPSDLEACPRCGEHTIFLPLSLTHVKDRTSLQEICAACGTEIAVTQLLMPGDFEIGGEGG